MSLLTPTLPAGPRPQAAAAAPGALDLRATATMLMLCLLWSLQQVSLKAAAGEMSPMLMIALRSCIALALLGLLMRSRGERLARERWRAGALAGLLFGLEFLLVSEALQRTQAAHVIVFLYTAPIFAALGLHLRWPAERMGAWQWAGALLAFAGIACAFLGPRAGAPGHAGGQALAGDALALLAALAWGATTVTLRSTRLVEAPATETLMYQLMGAALLLLPAALLSGQAQFTCTPRVLAHLGFQSLVVSFASFLTWCWLLRRYLASQLGMFSFMTPLFGVLLGAALLDETLEASFLASSVLVLAGIGLVSAQGPLQRAWRQARQRRRAH